MVMRSGSTTQLIPDNRITMNLLGGDTDANAYLFLVSTVLTEAARLRAVEDAGDGPEGSVNIDGNLQEIINTISLDLAGDGAIAASLTTELDAAERSVDADEVIGLLLDRLAELESSASVPDMNRVHDADGHRSGRLR